MDWKEQVFFFLSSAEHFVHVITMFLDAAFDETAQVV